MSANPIFETIVCPRTPAAPRQSEASMIALAGGRLLLAYSDFYGGHLDHSAARISGKLSADAGRTWGPAFAIEENDAGQNVMSPSLLRLATGKLLHFFLRKNSDEDLACFVRRSTDEGATWGPAVNATPAPGYHCVNNDRVVQLSTGRIVVPAAHTPHVLVEVPKPRAFWQLPVEEQGRPAVYNHFRSWCYLSDDCGQTWRAGAGQVDLPGRGAMEPGVVELRDGRLLMVIRTQLGRVYTAYSEDGGDVWGPARPTSLVAPESPATVRRIPSTGDLLILWNDHYDPSERLHGARSPLAAALSRDEGTTWQPAGELEPATGWEGGFSYPSILFQGDEVVLTYYEQQGANELWALKVKIVPVRWFYGE